MAERLLEGRVAIVTGAGSQMGMGRAMSLALVKAGARVTITDINEEWVQQSANDFRKIGGDDCVLPMVLDVSDSDRVKLVVDQTIKELGGLHILVNNAGVYPRIEGATDNANFWLTSPEAWTRIVAVNLSGPFFTARAVISHMIDQGWGRIIGVTTSMASMYREGGSPYGPSKAGHEAPIATMAREIEGTGVTANVLVPGGSTNTNMIPPDAPWPRSALIQSEVMQAPLLWLCSEEASETNGRRFIAYHWDESLPLEERLEKSGAPAAWPQLGGHAIVPDADA